MRHPHKWPMFVALLVLGLASTPLSAISPSAVMVYGDKVGQPILLRPASPAEFPALQLLWWKAGSFVHPTRTAQSEPELLNELAQRPYVKLAIFWGPYDANEFKPEAASQHGRYYLPTASDPAIVVATVPDMQKRSNPIPKDLRGFAALWSLSSEDQAALKSLGFPSLEPGTFSIR